MSIRPSTGLLAALALSAAPAFSHAAIVANFKDGNSTTAADGYVGAAGTGGSWTSAWTRINTGATATIASDSVLTGNSPTTGGGNYLNATVRATAASLAGSGAFVGRTFDNTAAGVPTTSAFSIAFDFRADVLPATGQYYQFFGNPGTSASGGSNTWVIRATASGTFQMLTNPTGTNVGTDTLAGITFAAGTNYRILVDVLDPATRKSQVTVSNDTISRTSNVEYFRTTALNGGNSIMVGSFVPAGAGDYGFNLDSVTVSSVPEPAGLLAAGSGAMLLLRRARRR